MATFPIEVRQNGSFVPSVTARPVSEQQVRVLIVSPDIEARQSLAHTLQSFPADVTECSNAAQAGEVLSRQTVDLVFCEESLPDGTYRDVLHHHHCGSRTSRVVVTTHSEEWNVYLKSLSAGAFDIIRRPWHPTDVEIVVIRALHEERRAR
jgi:DNA-binding NtrC family response regulator